MEKIENSDEYRLPPFTYFEDNDGFIYYSSADNSMKQESVRCTMTYVPSDWLSMPATRVQADTSRGYDKVISHGYTSELPRLRNTLSAEAFDRVLGKFVTDIESRDEYLAVPSVDIVRVYKPNASLNYLMAGASRRYSESSVKKITEAVEMFGRRGINPDRLGLYGGLQVQLTHIGSNELNDVDLLVKGIEAYDHIVEISRKNIVRPDTFPGFIAQDSIKRAVAIRRGQLSQFRLPSFPDVSVDVRIVREADEQRVRVGRVIGNEVMTKAVVTAADGSLSLPAQYEIRSEDGLVQMVTSPHYHHLGAAGLGDSVTVRGYAADDILMLADAEKHYIVGSNAVR